MNFNYLKSPCPSVLRCTNHKIINALLICKNQQITEHGEYAYPLVLNFVYQQLVNTVISDKQNVHIKCRPALGFSYYMRSTSYSDIP